MQQMWYLLVLITVVRHCLGTLTIEMPKGSFCELDAIKDCGVDDCIRFDPNVKEKSPSLITVLAEGPTGPMISAYCTMLWINWSHNLPIFLEKSTKMALAQIFEGVNGMKTLEESLCNWREFGFEKLNVDIYDGLKRAEYRTGRSLVLPHNVPRPSNSWLRFHKENRKKTKRVLTFLPAIEMHAEKTFNAVLKKIQVMTVQVLSLFH